MPLKRHLEGHLIIESSPRKVSLTNRKLQMKFKHASALGIEGSFSKLNAQVFMEAIHAYVQDPAVEQIIGTFRGDHVIHYYHAERKINLMTEPDGTFISVWGLTAEQIDNLEARGSL